MYGFQQYKIIWPANSPELNPIEELWRRMKDRLFQANKEGVLRTVDAMKDVTKEIWDDIALDDELHRESHTAGSDLGLIPRFMAVRCEASWFVI
ncbi:hypothetical protein L873DRAFT_1813051 [Choiromyces venosus 120613-1]|uniref:Tc1-like transposase DDE domain-containing protein n=1 Tax=Choiromyces venosus 120613-1 TaxID=1336337 RepID=A0A3N4JN86_9PEZI|nr:hypothetical protein L873DRAFT_1813051 [Choiromyces venosus 120613-1]